MLSGGVKQMAEETGADPEEAAHVKGLEVPMHDPRAYQGAALAYAVGPRGACHLKGSFYNLDAPGNEIGLELGITFTDKNDPDRTNSCRDHRRRLQSYGFTDVRRTFFKFKKSYQQQTGHYP